MLYIEAFNTQPAWWHSLFSWYYLPHTAGAFLATAHPRPNLLQTPDRYASMQTLRQGNSQRETRTRFQVSDTALCRPHSLQQQWFSIFLWEYSLTLDCPSIFTFLTCHSPLQ